MRATNCPASAHLRLRALALNRFSNALSNSGLGGGGGLRARGKTGYRDYRGLGWLVAVRQPANLALAPARDLQRTIAGWGFVLTAVLVTVSWISAGRLARRIRTIELAANRIREGDVLTVLPRPRGEGELAQMCGALGELVQELRENPSTAAHDNHPPSSVGHAGEPSRTRSP